MVTESAHATLGDAILDTLMFFVALLLEPRIDFGRRCLKIFRDTYEREPVESL